jgi:hypothetical protein
MTTPRPALAEKRLAEIPPGQEVERKQGTYDDWAIEAFNIPILFSPAGQTYRVDLVSGDEGKFMTEPVFVSKTSIDVHYDKIPRSATSSAVNDGLDFSIL